MSIIGETKGKEFSLLDESKKIFESRFYDSFFINEYGKLEGIRSERYGYPFSIIITHVESFYRGEHAPSKKELLDFLKILVTTVLKVVRNCDVVGMLEDRRIVIILPHTDYFGSLIAIKKLSKALESITTDGEPYASLIFSQATYPKDAKGYGELVSFATKKISDMRGSLWEKLSLKNKFFWEIMSTLTEGNHTNGFEYSTFEVSGSIETSLIQKINEAIIQEISRKPDKKGVLYVGGHDMSNNIALKKPIESMNKISTRIYIVGDGLSNVEVKNSKVVPIVDERFSNTYFTFFVSEDSSYALICKESWQGAYLCFHTSDAYLVEGLVAKFQRDYALQE